MIINSIHQLDNLDEGIATPPARGRRGDLSRVVEEMTPILKIKLD